MARIEDHTLHCRLCGRLHCPAAHFVTQRRTWVMWQDLFTRNYTSEERDRLREMARTGFLP